jgi:phage host-nuclease inhibitor protein Gam
MMATVSLIKREAEARSRSRQAESDRANRLAELTADREKLRLEVEAADRKAEREKEVLLSLIEKSQQLHELKINGIIAMFRDAKSVFEAHQRFLANEKAEYHRSLVECTMCPQQHVMVMRRQREIDRALSTVDDAMAELTEECICVIANLHPELGMTSIQHSVTNTLLPLIAPTP